MAQVPNYAQPFEKEAPLSGARIETVASPALLDAGAEETAKLAKGIMGAGAGLDAIALHMAQRENADVIFTNEAADKEAFIKYDAELRSNRQGNAAKGAANDTAAWWKDRISKNLEKMNDEQKRVYTQRITPVQLNGIHSVSQFEGQQTEIAHDQSWAADKTNTTNLAAAMPTPNVVTASMLEIKKFNAYQGARKGWSPEVLEAENVKDVTELHKQVIQTLAKDNPVLAESYYRAHEQEIAGSARAEIGKFAQQATAAKIGADAAQEIWTREVEGKGDNVAANVDVMAKEIREKFKNDPYTRDVALKQLHELDQTRDKSIKARDGERTAQVNSMLLGGKSLAAVMQTPAWAGLDGTEQKRIKEHEDAQSLVRENRAFVREGRELQQMQRKQHELSIANIDIAMKLSNPDELVKLSRDQVINLRTTIGNDSTKELLAKWDLYTKNGTALSEAKIDADQFAKFARRAGLDPEVTAAKDKDMAVRVKNLRDDVERIIGSEQQTRKKALTREERDVIMQKLIDDQVIQHNVILRDQPVPAIVLPLDKQTSAYVVVNGEEVKLASIPADYRAAITAERRKRSLPVTEKIIAELWVKKRNATRKPVDLPDAPVNP